MSHPVIGDAAWVARHVFGAGRPTQADLVKARRWLVRLDHRHGGKLLGAKAPGSRLLRFPLAVLHDLEPDLFRPVETLESRIEALEAELEERGEQIRALADAHRALERQLAANTRELVRAAAIAERARRATNHASVGGETGGRAPLAGPVGVRDRRAAPTQPRPGRRSDER